MGSIHSGDGGLAAYPVVFLQFGGRFQSENRFGTMTVAERRRKSAIGGLNRRMTPQYDSLERAGRR